MDACLITTPGVLDGNRYNQKQSVNSPSSSVELLVRARESFSKETYSSSSFNAFLEVDNDDVSDARDIFTGSYFETPEPKLG